MKNNREKINKPLDLSIKLTSHEITYVIMALVMAKQSARNLGNEYSEKMFKNLQKYFEKEAKKDTHKKNKIN